MSWPAGNCGDRLGDGPVAAVRVNARLSDRGLMP